MTNEQSDERYIVPALAQGLAVLSLFTAEKPTLTAPEIARALSLSRTKIFRLLHTLQTLGYIRRDDDPRRVRLGPAILSRGFSYLNSLDLVEIAQPILVRLRDLTDLSAHLAVQDGDEIVYVARIPTRATIASSVHIGTRFPIHATIMGRIMLCETPEAELHALFPRDALPPSSDQTPTTFARLKTLLAEDRMRGYAVSRSFFERGVSAVAAPVRNGAGRIVAAINVTSIDNYLGDDEMSGRIKDLVLDAAAEINQWMTQDTPVPPAPQAARRPRQLAPL